MGGLAGRSRPVHPPGMPICEADPWRLQYFAGIACPDDVLIPTEDADAWRWNPAHRWVYDKLRVAESQGFVCGPHGLEPPAYPVFSKPIVNLRGMSVGSRVLRSAREYRARQRPGHFWMPLLEGEHVSSDVVIEAGRPRWWRHAVGLPLAGGRFDYWTVHGQARPGLEDYCSRWLAAHLGDYTGMVNLETIGGRIIEVHLRFADQWPDLYGGRGWVEALIGLYASGRWCLEEGERRDGYSLALFGEHGRRYRHPPQALTNSILEAPGISSVQITFHEEQPARWHAMPSGGFRLAIVNCWDLAAGQLARARLAAHFDAAASVAAPRRGRRAASHQE